jgi:hypothetical protein
VHELHPEMDIEYHVQFIFSLSWYLLSLSFTRCASCIECLLRNPLMRRSLLSWPLPLSTKSFPWNGTRANQEDTSYKCSFTQESLTVFNSKFVPSTRAHALILYTLQRPHLQIT